MDCTLAGRTKGVGADERRGAAAQRRTFGRARVGHIAHIYQASPNRLRRYGHPVDPPAAAYPTVHAMFSRGRAELIRGRLHPLPGVHEFVADCRRRGLALAVASSADAIKVQGNLHDIGLPASTFDVVIDGSHVSRKKPAPDLFLEASRLLGLLPEQCFLSSRMPLRDSRRPRPLARDAWRLARGSLPNGSPRPTGSPPNLADVPPEALSW